MKTHNLTLFKFNDGEVIQSVDLNNNFTILLAAINNSLIQDLDVSITYETPIKLSGLDAGNWSASKANPKTLFNIEVDKEVETIYINQQIKTLATDNSIEYFYTSIYIKDEGNDTLYYTLQYPTDTDLTWNILDANINVKTLDKKEGEILIDVDNIDPQNPLIESTDILKNGIIQVDNNKTDIATNKTDIATNKTNITNNRTDININISDINALKAGQNYVGVLFESKAFALTIPYGTTKTFVPITTVIKDVDLIYDVNNQWINVNEDFSKRDISNWSLSATMNDTQGSESTHSIYIELFTSAGVFEKTIGFASGERNNPITVNILNWDIEGFVPADIGKTIRIFVATTQGTGELTAISTKVENKQPIGAIKSGDVIDDVVARPTTGINPWKTTIDTITEKLVITPADTVLKDGTNGVVQVYGGAQTRLTVDNTGVKISGRITSNGGAGEVIMNNLIANNSPTLASHTTRKDYVDEQIDLALLEVALEQPTRLDNGVITLNDTSKTITIIYEAAAFTNPSKFMLNLHGAFYFTALVGGVGANYIFQNITIYATTDQTVVSYINGSYNISALNHISKRYTATTTINNNLDIIIIINLGIDNVSDLNLIQFDDTSGMLWPWDKNYPSTTEEKVAKEGTFKKTILHLRDKDWLELTIDLDGEKPLIFGHNHKIFIDGSIYFEKEKIEYLIKDFSFNWIHQEKEEIKVDIVDNTNNKILKINTVISTKDNKIQIDFQIPDGGGDAHSFNVLDKSKYEVKYSVFKG